MMISIKDIFEQEVETKCKGLFFRGIVNQYFRPPLGLVQKREVRLLKKISCSGCVLCGWWYDEFAESDTERFDLSHIENGKTYTVGTKNESRDWETGCIDMYDVVFNEVSP